MNTANEDGPQRDRGAAALACGGNAQPARNAARGGGACQRPRARPPLRIGARGAGADHPSERDARRAVAAGDDGAVRQDRCRAGAPRGAFDQSRRRIREFFASLSPRTLAWSAGAAALAIVLQAADDRAASCSRSRARAATRRHRSSGSASGEGAYALIRFQPQASAAEITGFLETNKLSIAGGPSAGGLYRVRIAATKLPKADLDRSVKTLQERQGRRFYRRPTE